MAKAKRTFYKKKPTLPPQAIATPFKFPSISRIIPAVRIPAISLVPEKELIVGFICGCLVVGIFFSSVRLVNAYHEYQAVLGEKKELLKQKSYWQSITRQFPQYRDAHFRLGVLTYQEGRKKEAREEALKALELDPSFTEARMFLEKIGKQKE